jgi:hypothetical protein
VGVGFLWFCEDLWRIMQHLFYQPSNFSQFSFESSSRYVRPLEKT